MTPLAGYLEVRTPSTAAHRDAIERTRRALPHLPIYPQVAAITG